MRLSRGLPILCSLVWACSGAEDAKETAARFSSGVVRVGYANESPFAYMDRGQLTGEAPEVARHVLALMGAQKVEGVLTEFGALVPGLKARRFEMLAAGTYVTPPRCTQVAFSEPTYCIAEALLVRRGNPLSLHAYEDVAKHGEARIGVVRGAMQYSYAEQMGIPRARIVVFPDPPSALAGLSSGRVDAYAATALTANELLTKLGERSELQRAAPFTTPVIDGKPVRGCGAFAFRPQDAAHRDSFNRHLERFLGSEEHLRIVGKFGFTKDDLPPPGVTTKALCTP